MIPLHTTVVCFSVPGLFILKCSNTLKEEKIKKGVRKSGKSWVA